MVGTSTCCCCIPLRTGVLIVGWFGIIGGVLMLLFGSIHLGIGTGTAQNLEKTFAIINKNQKELTESQKKLIKLVVDQCVKILEPLFIVAIVYGAVHTLLSSILVRGVCKNVVGFCQIWMLYEFLSILGGVGVGIAVTMWVQNLFLEINKLVDEEKKQSVGTDTQINTNLNTKGLGIILGINVAIHIAFQVYLLYAVYRYTKVMKEERAVGPLHVGKQMA